MKRVKIFDKSVHFAECNPNLDDPRPRRWQGSLFLVTALLWVAQPSTAQAEQSFTNLNVGLPAFSPGTLAWGDFDNDGKLDVLLTGYTPSGYLTQVWRNQGNGTFVNLNAGLPGVFKSCAAWGDYDNDGKLDILVAGLDINLNPLCQVWHNQGNGTFTQANVLLPGLSSGSVAWADFDNDGRLDILLTGADTAGNPLTQIWRNQGDGSFINWKVGLTPVKTGCVAVGDLDNDGYLDVVLTGIDPNNTPVAQMWRNLGNGTFTQINPGFTGVYASSVALADYDNDGKIDLLITGANAAAEAVTQLWHNQGGLSFSAVNAGLPPVYFGGAAWGDYDNDGKLDILLSGYDAKRVPITQLWRNLGAGVFTNTGVTFPGLGTSGLAWGDFDGDGKLDVLLAGSTGSSSLCQLWRNLTAESNTPPNTPTGLAASLTSTGAILSWEPASDAQTQPGGLSYNLRLGSYPGGADLISPASDLVTGFRRLQRPGNAQQALSVSLPLPPGNYYWSVQSLDSSFAGSPFAPESSFTLGAIVTTTPATQVSVHSATLNGTVNPRGVNTSAWFQWGETTNYGNTLSRQNVGNGSMAMDFSQMLLSLQPGTTYHYCLVASDLYGVTYGEDQSFTTPAASPPVLSDFTNLALARNTPSLAIPFTVSSAVVPADALVVTASAADQNLVPAANLVLGGAAINRTLSIYPAAGLCGTTAVSVSVSDGSCVTTKSFSVAVGLIPGDQNNDGIVDQPELNAVLSNYWPHSPWVRMINFSQACDATHFEFALTNSSAWNFSVLVSTDQVNWSVLPTPAVPVYQFIDPSATTNASRYYRLQWP